MALVFPNEGEIYLLKKLLKDTDAGTIEFIIGLFSNNFTPLKASVLADITPATFTGYSPVTAARSVWTDPITVADGSAQSTYDTTFLQWIPTSGTQDIYGWYITDPDANYLIAAERFATAPITISTTNPIILLPVIRLHSEYQP